MNNRVFRLRPMHLLLILASINFGVEGSSAQSEKEKDKDPEKISIGTSHEIHSKILGEKRTFSVSNPDGYDGKGKAFMTIYVLDGPFHFQHTTALVDFLVRNDLMPPAIVVSVNTPNPERSRDLTPSAKNPMKGIEMHGGADKFVGFLRDELIPHIESKFAVGSHRTLIGHSFGGLFAIHTLVHHQDTFDAYLAISPSLQWDDQKLVQQSEKFFKEATKLNKSLYMTSGNEGGALTGGVQKVAGILEEHQPEGFTWKHRIMSEETHGTVVYRSTRQGLEFIFSDWALRNPISIYDRGGLKALESFHKKSAKKYGVKRPVAARTFAGVVFELIRRKRFDESLKLVKEDAEKEKPLTPDYYYPFMAGAYEDAKQKEAAKAIYHIILKSDSGDKKAREALVRLGVPEAELPKIDKKDAKENDSDKSK